MRITFFVNPHAGKGRAGAIAKSATAHYSSLGHQITVIEEDSLERANDKLRTNLAVFPPERVIVVGGDGNVHWSLQELAHSSSALQVIPTGTGNDFARHHGFIKSGSPVIAKSQRSIDLGLISYGSEKRYFGQILSTGFDSLVNKRANEMKYLRGRIKYTVATILELRSFTPLRYSLTVDGKKRTVEAIMVAVGNGDSYGGGMKLIPEANPSDGKLDLFILHAVSKWELIKVFPKIFSGRHVTHPAVEIRRVKRVIIDSDALVYADGEYVTRGKVAIEIDPAALLLVDQP